MTDEEKKEKLTEALLKCATGYTAVDEVEEYVLRDGVMDLQKRKINTRDVAPELAAIKMLLDGEKENPLQELTENQLLAEKDRLLKMLQEKQS